VIIVVGVLTALGAEAIVENVHERRLSAEAKEAVRDEINVNVTGYASRMQAEPCVTRRIQEIRDLLDAAEARKSYTPPAFIGGPLEPGINTSRWAAATAGGRTSLLSSKEQRQFGNFYSRFQHLELRQEQEYQTWLTLRALVGVRHPSQGLIDQERLALERARSLDASIRNAFESARIYAQRLGVKGDAQLAPARHVTPGVLVICRPMNVPFDAG
jgi:hypothetical protein